jgi:hypothetical protein
VQKHELDVLLLHGPQRELPEAQGGARWVQEASFAAVATEHIMLLPECCKVGAARGEFVDQALQAGFIQPGAAVATEFGGNAARSSPDRLAIKLQFTPLTLLHHQHAGAVEPESTDDWPFLRVSLEAQEVLAMFCVIHIHEAVI